LVNRWELIKLSKTHMKKMFNKVVTFGKREWFLLVMVVTITLIIVLFEML
jgi:hypothetical protein